MWKVYIYVYGKVYIYGKVYNVYYTYMKSAHIYVYEKVYIYEMWKLYIYGNLTKADKPVPPSKRLWGFNMQMKENRTIDWKCCILSCCCHPKISLNTNPKTIFCASALANLNQML